MSDRTSAELFATLFKRLAREPNDERRARLVLDVWRMSRRFDFHPCQMECESTLAKLGLARKTGDKDEPWVSLRVAWDRWEQASIAAAEYGSPGEVESAERAQSCVVVAARRVLASAGLVPR